MWHDGDVTWPTCETVGSNEELYSDNFLIKTKNNNTPPSPICLKFISDCAKFDQSGVFTSCDFNQFERLIQFTVHIIAPNEPNLKQLIFKQKLYEQNTAGLTGRRSPIK